MGSYTAPVIIFGEFYLAFLQLPKQEWLLVFMHLSFHSLYIIVKLKELPGILIQAAITTTIVVGIILLRELSDGFYLISILMMLL